MIPCAPSSRNADTYLGTGKSVLLREIIKALHKKFVKTPDAVAVTASTGINTVQFSILVGCIVNAFSQELLPVTLVG